MKLSGAVSMEATSRLGRDGRNHHVRHAHDRILAVTTVVRRQPGGSQSCLVRCDDGKLYVLKMNPNPQGPNVLANEALGSILLRGLGLRAPPWRAVTIDLKTVRFFPELAMQTSAQKISFPACGIHFGSEYLGGPQYDLYNFMPPSYLYRLRSTAQFLPIYLFDIWASHQDERQCVYQRMRGTSLYDSFFIDNGHLFGGPAWSEVEGHCRGICSGNVQAPLIGDPRIELWMKVFEDRIPKLLHEAITAVPGDWYEDDIYLLFARLLWRLETIRTLVDQEMTTKGVSCRTSTTELVSGLQAHQGRGAPCGRLVALRSAWPAPAASNVVGQTKREGLAC
jgi:hypothetical protein